MKRMSTANRMDLIRSKQKVSRVENGTLKRKERAARDARMATLIGKGTFPFTPAVMSWVSVKLGKPSTQITEAEAKALGK
jgi:hypothetical protein